MSSGLYGAPPPPRALRTSVPVALDALVLARPLAPVEGAGLRVADARRERMAPRPRMGAPVDVAVGLEAGQELERTRLLPDDLLEVRAALPGRRGAPARLGGGLGLAVAVAVAAAGRRRGLGAHPVSVGP